MRFLLIVMITLACLGLSDGIGQEDSKGLHDSPVGVPGTPRMRSDASDKVCCDPPPPMCPPYC